MKKKYISLFLALVMMLSLAVPGTLATDDIQENTLYTDLMGKMHAVDFIPAYQQAEMEQLNALTAQQLEDLIEHLDGIETAAAFANDQALVRADMVTRLEALQTPQPSIEPSTEPSTEPSQAPEATATPAPSTEPTATPEVVVTPAPVPTATPEAENTENQSGQSVEATTDTGIKVTVAGNLPVGVQLLVSDYSDMIAMPFAISDEETTAENPVKAVLDISLQDAEQNAYQPSEDGQSVLVTISAASMGLADGSIVSIEHIHDDDTVTTIEPVVVINGQLMFYVDSFSIFVVSSIGTTTGTQISSGSIQTMVVGETRIFYADQTGVKAWEVTDRESVLTWNVFNAAQNTDTVNAAALVLPWIVVTAKRAGEADVTIRYNGQYLGSNKTDPTCDTESFKIKVSERGNFHIENEIVENGCLIPVGLLNSQGVKYTWTRSDGLMIKSAALGTDGAVNVSIDRGGISNSTGAITYTVTATDANGNVLGTDSYEVPYGNEILNPGFEFPIISLPVDYQYRYAFYPNGTPGLYWKTTAPGLGSSMGLDIELGWTDQNPYGIGSSAEGNQFAELNAEGAGTLYQDILTSGGSRLEWHFSHTARDGDGDKDFTDENDTMFIVVAATQYGQTVIDYDDTLKLVNAAVTAAGGSTAANGDTGSIPQSGEGFEFTYGGGTYRIWKDTATTVAQTAAQWNQISGWYDVPDGQYLTRLFFVSDPRAGKDTIGNCIDGAYAGEFMSSKVEYYKEDVLQGNHTEQNDRTPAYRAVTLANLGNYSKYPYAHKIIVNGKPYPGTLEELRTTGLYITSYGEKPAGQAEDILLQIYFRDVSIIVEKEFVLEGWDALTEAEKTALIGDGLTATFGLFNGEEKVKEATVTVTGASATTGKLVAQVAFDGLNTTHLNTPFTVREITPATITNYELIPPADQTVILTDNESIKKVEFTNEYKKLISDLTITKTVEGDVEPNQAFIFHVTGEGYDTYVTIYGAGSVTINDLYVGKDYTVEEMTDWSWRYDCTSTNPQTIKLSADETKNVVAFTNEHAKDDWLGGDSYAVNTQGIPKT